MDIAEWEFYASCSRLKSLPFFRTLEFCIEGEAVHDQTGESS
jgi:hypothetical protein